MPGADPSLDDVVGHVAKSVTVGPLRLPEFVQVHLLSGALEAVNDTLGSAGVGIGRFKTGRLEAAHGEAPFLVECRRAMHPQFPFVQTRIACLAALKEGHWPGVTSFAVPVPNKGEQPRAESCPAPEAPVTGYLVALPKCPACRGTDAVDFAETVFVKLDGTAPDKASAQALAASQRLKCQPCGRVP
jgi:hypothetical protein